MSRRIALVIAPALLISALVAGSSPALAGPTSPTTASVSLGDSFISGEAGRWFGNSLNAFGTRDGTDRAALCPFFCSYDATRVYGSSYSNGCHRSDVATISSAVITGITERINIACSGARTENIWRASQGGVAFKGEAPQADQLASIAAEKNVKLIVLTIIANDVGFADHVIDCTVAWSTSSASNPHYCNQQEQAEIDAAMPAARVGLAKGIDEIRAVMAGAGYSASQYKLVIAGYSSPIPIGRNIRYPETGWSRLDQGGCPFWDADADWAKNTATPSIVDNMRQIAASKGVQFLDVRDALNGHEACHKSSSLVDGGPPNAISHEWVRWVNSGCCQGDSQESMHPNAYGQKAIGKCVSLMYAKTSGNWTCKNTKGKDFTAMTLTSIT